MILKITTFVILFILFVESVSGNINTGTRDNISLPFTKAKMKGLLSIIVRNFKAKNAKNYDIPLQNNGIILSNNKNGISNESTIEEYNAFPQNKLWSYSKSNKDNYNINYYNQKYKEVKHNTAKKSENLQQGVNKDEEKTNKLKTKITHDGVTNYNRKGKILWPNPNDKQEIIKNHTHIAMQMRPTTLIQIEPYTNKSQVTSQEANNIIIGDMTVKNNIVKTPNNIENSSNQYNSNETKLQQNIRKKKNKKHKTLRNGRLFWSYPQSPIVEIMTQTLAVDYTPNVHNDPFDFLRDSYPLPKGYVTPLEEYDFIIIGAGSAGSVLAARLSEEKPRHQVLLIEAGKPEMLLTDIPALAPYFQTTDYAWQYPLEFQAGVCMGMMEQRCVSSRGKAIGGNSVINNMVYSRGRPYDWDRIAEDGNSGWSYNDISKYFMRSERSELRRYKDAPYRGQHGEVTVENTPFRTGLVEAFLEAGRIYDYPTVDYNAPTGFGFGYVQTTTSKGHRISAAKAFLHRHKKRKNLHILSEARATKILIESETKKAYAVNYNRNNKKYQVRARKEIILSAGPISSPQLLMLSGIGPTEHLNNLNISVIKHLNVGKTMYDHISFPGLIFKLNSTTASILEEKVATIPNLLQWLQFGDGLFASPSLIEGIGYIKASVPGDRNEEPDVEILSLAGSLTSDAGGAMRKGMGISDITYHKAFWSLKGKDTWSGVPVLLYPRSKGYLELRDKNPFNMPKIVSNFLTDEFDIFTLKNAIKFIILLGESKPFQKYGAELHLPNYPTCTNNPVGSDQYWECALRTLATTQNHQMGTCKMGPTNDPDAVVDAELNVYGIKGLRVVDSSIIPRPISAHTNIASLMIAEKAADLIKNSLF